MNDNEFKVINETGEESIAKIITSFTYKEKDYLVYYIEKEDNSCEIYTSMLLKDNNGNDMICDIDDDIEREEVFKVVEEIISAIEEE